MAKAPRAKRAAKAPRAKRAPEAPRAPRAPIITGAKRPTNSAHESEIDALAPINDELESKPRHKPKQIKKPEVDPITSQPKPINSRKFSDLQAEYRQYFVGAVIKDTHKKQVAAITATALKNKDRYISVGSPLGIPWWFIAGIHLLESSFNFNAHLHNGDPLTAQTVRVPPGRPAHRVPPPKFTWEESAEDALKMKNLNGLSDWSLSRALHRWELYNGMGYRSRLVPTPYLWSFSSIYKSGKFVADGKFDKNSVSKQCGAAVFLRHLFDEGEVVLFDDTISSRKQDHGRIPKPQPGGSETSAFASSVANIATEFFDKHHLETEDDPDLAAQIKKFWELIGRRFPGTNVAWSAVFVSACFKLAGARKSEFEFSAAHSEFVHKAISNASKGIGTFRAYPIESSPPKVGDIIQNNRGGRSFDFDHARNHKNYPSHSAIVTTVGRDQKGNFAITIGGNESDSIRKNRVRLDSKGFVVQRTRNPYICVVQNLK